VAVGRRSLPFILTAIVAAADLAGAHALAFDALVFAIPFTAVAALDVLGTYLDRRDDVLEGMQAALWGVALALLVVSGAVRSPSVRGDELPSAGWSALVACLAVLGLKGLLGIVPHVRRGGLRIAKP
jgi:hypothetical protein